MEALRHVLLALPTPALIKDQEHCVLLANDAYLTFVGKPRGDVLGRDDFALFPWEQARAIRDRDLAALGRAGPTEYARETLTGANGDEVPWKSVRLPTANGVSPCLVLLLQRNSTSPTVGPAGIPDDALEEQVRERTLALRSAQNARLKNERLIVVGQLASGLAHQIRNPLGAISNALALVRRHTPSGDVVTQALDIAEEEVWAANRILTDLLDYSRIRTAELSTIQVAGLVEAALEGENVPDGITVQRKVGNEAALADFRQAADALGKLIRNAVEAMEGRGTLTFETSVAGAYVELRITDTGVGVSASAAELLFEPLVSSKPLGIGLGLAAARALINNQGGNVSCEAVEGGARFLVRLPRPISEIRET